MNFREETQGKKTIFLDRDGTINEEVNYLYKKEELKLIDGAAEAIALFCKAGYRVVVVTNQAGVARGYYTEEDVKILHQYLNEVLAPCSAHIDAFYYCPHHPVHGLGKYKTDCECRKPKTGLLKQAERDCMVDKTHSWMIGDKISDIKAGRAYGVGTILVGTGYGRKIYEQDCLEKREKEYDVYQSDLYQAAVWILNREQKGEERQHV